MTSKDLPYVLFITGCMIVAFMSGRASKTEPVAAPAASTIIVTVPSAAPTVSTDPETMAFIKRWEEEHGNDVPPPVVVPSAKPVSSSKPLTVTVGVKPVAAGPTIRPVTPAKIELEDDPAAIQNPYKVKPMASSHPGF